MTDLLSTPRDALPPRADRTVVHRQRFDVRYDYPVCFTRRLFWPGNSLLAEILADREPERRHRCLVVVDQGLLDCRLELPREIQAYADTHASVFTLVAPPVPVPGGERIKADPAYQDDLRRLLHHHHIDRHAFVLAIGGGAMLDAVGLVAATMHRGVRLVRVPTTVLAQNDSGVGVKNGVNAYGVKNLIGTFAPPFAVLNDLDFIDHLPQRDKIAGMAEAVKVALIRDRQFFCWLERHAKDLLAFNRHTMAYMIEHCALLHMRQIAQGGDPFEHGSARPLDFGHWSAHKLESLTDHALRHGEAVAIGIALDTRYSVTAGLIDPGADLRVAALLEALGFSLWHSALEARDDRQELALLKGLEDFREHLGGELTVTLLAGIGHGVEVHAMDEDRVSEAIAWLKSRELA